MKTKNNINYKLMEDLIIKYGVPIALVSIVIYIGIAIFTLWKKNYALCLLFIFIAFASIGITMELIEHTKPPTTKIVNVDELSIFHGQLYYRDTLVNIEKNVKAELFILRCKEEIVLKKGHKDYYFLFKDNE